MSQRCLICSVSCRLWLCAGGSLSQYSAPSSWKQNLEIKSLLRSRDGLIESNTHALTTKAALFYSEIAYQLLKYHISSWECFVQKNLLKRGVSNDGIRLLTAHTRGSQAADHCAVMKCGYMGAERGIQVRRMFLSGSLPSCKLWSKQCVMPWQQNDSYCGCKHLSAWGTSCSASSWKSLWVARSISTMQGVVTATWSGPAVHITEKHRAG